MNINLYRSSSLATREMLFIGFSGDFDANIFNFPYHSEEYDYEVINKPLKAIQWLEKKVEGLESYQPPFAIIYNLKWLMEDEFRLIKQISANPDLKFIPVIALAEKFEECDKSLILKAGVDDCYTMPVEWDMLVDRLEFLNQYKPRVMEHGQKVESEDFVYHMPIHKRLVDILISATAILMLSPILLLVAIAIRLESKGQIIYRSKRVGTGYKVFDFLKFRSMYADADQRLAEFKHLNQYNDENAVFVKIANDPRITRVGRFIRKYSIDELPQLFNILLGDMSVVGNRPLPLYEAEQLTKDEWSRRFLAPAGLTGLWQVTKRGKSDMSVEERINLDITYAKNYSISTDMHIIFKTFSAFIQKEDV